MQKSVSPNRIWDNYQIFSNSDEPGLHQSRKNYFKENFHQVSKDNFQNLSK
jgi:hypothetical protein